MYSGAYEWQLVRAEWLRAASRGVFDFTLLASLADEPGCGQPEPGSTHSRLMFDLFSPVRHAELVFVFDMVQRWVK